MDHMTLNIVLRARIPGSVKMGTVMQSKGKIIKNALKCAFPYTIPIFAGFWFLGLTYGVYMNVSGFSFWYPMLMSLTIFGGSLEFVAVSMLLAPYAPVQVFQLVF